MIVRAIFTAAVALLGIPVHRAQFDGLTGITGHATLTHCADFG